MSSDRNIIVHYHLFKNAGSSVDQLLKQNFNDRWMTYDGTHAGAIIVADELQGLIADNPDIEAISSHQIVPPLPQVEANVYPIVFLRDPIDRIKSAYLFEWKKQLGTDTPKGTLESYIKEKFALRRKNSIEEFQTLRLSNTQSDQFHQFNTVDDNELLERATQFIESLDFVGIVDEFDRSSVLLSNFLREAFPDFVPREVKANVLQDLSLSQEAKRDMIRQELGDELFEMIVERNRLDEALYQSGRRHFNKLCTLVQPDISASAA
ncbi:hypothetical protein AB833_06800 [Chromatiales bacterium (ex Bugula neritina AB1)]|nr:hypothetical protein AB833_06800 [Chromatiales bacterium (ex Bugula neritina AB1)]